MIIDSSALLAIFYKELGCDLIAGKMEQATARFISAPTYVEAYIVVTRRSGEASGTRLKRMLGALAIDIVGFTPEQADVAQKAFLLYGKGRHPAQLNLGDCFSYALSKSYGQPLLFKGGDFTQTDVLIA